MLDKILSENGISLHINENLELRNKIINRININDGHCPCVSTINEDTVCPCKEVRVCGVCHCGLYKKD